MWTEFRKNTIASYGGGKHCEKKDSPSSQDFFTPRMLLLVVAVLLLAVAPPLLLKIHYLLQEAQISRIFNSISPSCLISQKVVLVTGATKGLGNTLFWRLAAMNAHVIGIGRSSERLQAVFPPSAYPLGGEAQNPPAAREGGTVGAEGQGGPHNGSTRTGVLNMSSLRSVDEFVDLLVKLNIQLDMLINNAAFLGPNERSAENFEMTFATNYLAHYYLTRRLIDTNRLPSGARCIFVVSNFYSTLSVNSTQLAQLPHKVWGDMEWFDAYKTTKFLLVALTNALSQVYPDRTFLAVHPGELHTGIMRNLPGLVGGLLRCFSYMWFPSANMGANLVLHAVCDPAMTSHSGDYVENCVMRTVTPAAGDRDFQKYLLQFSDRLIAGRARG